jgi:K+-transporting ATPase c subunit
MVLDAKTERFSFKDAETQIQKVAADLQTKKANIQKCIAHHDWIGFIDGVIRI